MDYRKMLEAQPQDKTAVIENGQAVTYRELLELSEEKKKRILEETESHTAVLLQQEGKDVIKKQLYFIKESTIIQELAAFLACQGGNLVPVILSDSLAEEEIQELRKVTVPQNAVMGVLTSGTTGKCRILFRTYESWACYFPYQNEIFSMDKDTVLFAQGSLSFTGNMNLYMALFSVGGTVVSTKEFKPRRWLSFIEEHQVNYIYLIPAKMLALSRVVKEPCRKVKHFVTGSQSFGVREAARVKKCFPEMSILLYYGSSEAGYVTYLSEREMTEDISLVGRPFPQVEVRIQNGIFYVDTDYGMIGMERPFCMGDLGRIDEKGYFYFEGRQDDLLSVNGRKCSAYRIEQQIREKLGIDEVMVSVCRNGDREYLAAYYERDLEEISTPQMKAVLRNSLSQQEIPKRFIRVEKLPRTDSGKLIRKQSILQNKTGYKLREIKNEVRKSVYQAGDRKEEDYGKERYYF